MNVGDTIPKEYRIVLGSQPRALRKAEARKLIQRETHGLVLHVSKDGYAQDKYFHWLGDLRRGRLRLYGALLRFIDMSRERNIPKAIIDHIPQWIAAYIDELWSDAPVPPTPAAKKEAAA